MYPYLQKNFSFLLTKHNIKVNKLAKIIGVSQPTLSRIAKEREGKPYRPEPENIAAIANWAGVTTEELTNKDLQESGYINSKTKSTDLLDLINTSGVGGEGISISELESIVYEDGSPIPEGYVAIDFYSEIKASAGQGYCNISNNSPQKIFIPFSEVLKYGANADSSKTFIVDGDSMLPELKPGYPITIDTSATRIVDGEIYAFLKGDELKIKFLHTWNDEGKGGFIARSSNPDKNRYPDEYYSPARIEADNIQILGQYWLKLAGTKVKR